MYMFGNLRTANVYQNDFVRIFYFSYELCNILVSNISLQHSSVVLEN